jgi:outer membrane protein OmpA-like peptidoglycan-associated protein
MSILDPLLVEILQALRAIQIHAVGLLGPLAPVVTGAGQIVAAAIAIFFFITGRGFFAPPTPGLRDYPTRITGVVAGVLIAALFVVTRRPPPFDILAVALAFAAAGLIGAIVYLFLYLVLSFRCEGDATLFVRGLSLTPEARQVLEGNFAGLPPVYAPPRMTRPANAKEYFCRSGKDPDFIWKPWSHALAQVILFITYFLAIMPLTLALASGSIALTLLDVHETTQATRLELPADVLFTFGESTIRDAAVPTLQKTADFCRDRHVTAARIEGHTDSKGSDAVNQRLSLARAEAVREWLASQSGLQAVRFSVAGLGASRPVAPNANPDGSDNPNGRLQNRRVTIIIDKTP